MTRIYLLLFLLLLSVFVFSQNIDSLRSEVAKAKTPLERFELWTNLVYIYQSKNDDSLVQVASVQLLQAALETQNDTSIFYAYLFLGGYYEAKADFNHSLENHFKALHVAEKGKINEAICLANEQAAVVYKQLRNNVQALFHLKEAEKYLYKKGVIENMPWLQRQVYANTAEVYLQMNEPDSALVYALLAEKIVDKKRDIFGYGHILNTLANTYSKKGQNDLAEEFYKKGIAFCDSFNESVWLVTSLYDYSKFLLKNGKQEEAKKYALKSLNEHHKRFNNYGTLSIEIADVLAKVFSALKQYDSAYYYSSQHDIQKDSLFNQNRLAEIQGITFSEKIRDTEEVMESQKATLKQKQTQMYFLLLALLLVAVVAFVAYRSFLSKKRDAILIQKEKDRSENLLLNILPAEVAEELKQKGSASAQHFDNVTVFFSDFKSFTTISEKLSPQQLVDELHECFSAFDNIISKHGIEKIKTVGDAYLCVAGLPAANPNHAVDVVNAALEIQDYMHQRKLQNQAREGLYDIRIGINSGSVVAGIVGVKKFAYDIWGDTVNTAARMEQNGEPGKVNISEATYELVKDKFNCVYRGEIDAKNKGKLKMYFLEPSA